ncbi:hypothetical protein OCU04_009835 [Sclerotinia nivalis]|uniref:Uncharacterized protein n=1 Tax=Sclerotinia nivalis TaxID=352851 RepID=A0A9X0DGX1_9HELO|nr:hypothetical protein OCU04_009835 [Sclerotinia nivalis]
MKSWRSRQQSTLDRKFPNLPFTLFNLYFVVIMPQSPLPLNHDTTRNTLRTHPYFDKTPCDKWDVVDFCNKIYEELGYVKYNISSVHNCWRTSIQHLQNSEDPKIAGVASKLRAAWVLSVS